MIDGRDRVRLVDFGIARAMPPPGDQSGSGWDPSTVTGPEAVLGTPEYMSPEQVMGWPLDVRSDVYSFGVVLYEMFTGRVPFHGASAAATMRKHLDEPPPFSGPQAALLPGPLMPILEKTLAKDPDQRYASVRELTHGLEAARASLRTDAMPRQPATAGPRWGLPALASLAAVAAFFAWSSRRGMPPQPGAAAGGPAGAEQVETTVRPAPPRETVAPTAAPVAHPTAVASDASPAQPAVASATVPARRHRPRPAPSLLTPGVADPTRAAPTPPPEAAASTSPAPVPVPTATPFRPPPTLASAPEPTAASVPVETPAECLSCPPPAYPPAAEKYGLEGDVEIEIVVDAKGRVIEARLLGGHPAFGKAAQRAVLTWRFAPATRGGVPVKSTRRFPVQFRLAPKE
jgi:serine/threonine-protein kinase